MSKDSGTPLEWDQTSKYATHVREHGITQFLHIWSRTKDRQGYEFLWGEEIECMVIVLDDETKNAKLSLRQTEILTNISESVKDEPQDPKLIPIFQTEYTGYMLESIPGSPYTGSIRDLLSVEHNMRHRRLVVKKHLNPNEVVATVTSFPRLGAPGIFTDPYFSPDGAKSTRSLFLPEELISPHPRYLSGTVNVRKRRGCKVIINIPIFIDEKTPRPFVDPTIPWQRSLYPEDAEAKNGAALIDHIYMDSLAFGAGCCCLQVTLQSDNIEEARHMCDSFAPLGPIMLALTAASPIWRGFLSDVDCRWGVLTDGFDDRNPEERGQGKSKHASLKSRCSSVNLYLSTDHNNRPAYNDINVSCNEEAYNRLVGNGIDETLSKHISRIFIRDPLVLFSESINQDDETSNSHFENLQSTNWSTVRFKPPPPKSSMGWRIEFRTMEVQLTDFENAAFAIFMVLLSRAILAFDLNFYVPLSKVEDNMSRAQKRDAVRQGNFFFRKNVLPPGHVPSTLSSRGWQNGVSAEVRKMQEGSHCVSAPSALVNCPVEEEYEEMSIQEIFSGKGTTFPGLIRLVEAYLETLDIDPSERGQISRYLDLVHCRANGSLVTTASWMRDFVRSHPSYKFDSVVCQEINYDLMVAVDKIERGILRVPELLPPGYAGSEVN